MPQSGLSVTDQLSCRLLCYLVSRLPARRPDAVEGELERLAPCPQPPPSHLLSLLLVYLNRGCPNTRLALFMRLKSLPFDTQISFLAPPRYLSTRRSYIHTYVHTYIPPQTHSSWLINVLLREFSPPPFPITTIYSFYSPSTPGPGPAGFSPHPRARPRLCSTGG